MEIDLRNLLAEARGYFSLTSYREAEADVTVQVMADVAFRGPRLWILMFAILIASLGLNTNSTAVIIGAMLISPLMGPIIGMGLAIGTNDFDLLKRCLKNFGVAVLISVSTATFFFLISPINEARSELLARTQPSIYDVLIAFFGGAAGVLALTTKGKGQVIPGVAIATALMPPLCTAGFGLATWQLNYFLGAFYLFFINTVFIALSTWLGVKLLKFEKKHDIAPAREKRAHNFITILLIVAIVPAAIMTWNIGINEVLNANVQKFVKQELRKPGTQLLSATAEKDTVRVVLVGRNIAEEEIADAKRRMKYYDLGGYALNIIQGSDAENIDALTMHINNMASIAEKERLQLSQQLMSAQRKLDTYDEERILAGQINQEAALLFPTVRDIRMGRISDGDTAAMVALVTLKGRTDHAHLTEWLRMRARNDSLEVVVR